MGIYNNNGTQIARIYNGATAEISTVRRAVSANFGQTVHEAEKPFTVHRWLRITDNAPSSELVRYFSFYAKNKISSTFRVDIGTNVGLMRIDSNNAIFFNGALKLQNPNRTFDTQQPYNITIGANFLKINDIVVSDIDIRQHTLSVYRTLHSDIDAYVSAVDIDNSTLSPAQLTRDTYTHEDNNGIRRHSGEWVMVDQSKFAAGLPYIWGNIAQSGAFSGDDYLIEGVDYERVAGVVGDGLSYILLQYGQKSNSVISFDYVGGTNTRGPYPGICGCTAFEKDGVRYWGCSVFATKNRQRLTYRTGNKVNWAGDMVFDVDVANIVIDASGISVNGVKKSNVADFTIPSPNVFFLFACSINNEYCDGTFKSFRISEDSTTIHNLIPVRLKRDIEPHCTHNGKGGTAGEICFFDTVSGRAFTNDGTGAFTEYVPTT